MSLPFVNARLRAIVGEGFAANYGRPAGAGTPVWEGDEDAHVADRALVRTAGDSRDQLTETVLTVPLLYRAGEPVAPEPGHAARYETADGGQHERKIESAVLDAALGEVRMTLEDA